jgi:hypothetical protein
MYSCYQQRNALKGRRHALGARLVNRDDQITGFEFLEERVSIGKNPRGKGLAANRRVTS